MNTVTHNFPQNKPNANGGRNRSSSVAFSFHRNKKVSVRIVTSRPTYQPISEYLHMSLYF